MKNKGRYKTCRRERGFQRAESQHFRGNSQHFLNYDYEEKLIPKIFNNQENGYAFKDQERNTKISCWKILQDFDSKAFAQDTFK